MANSKYSWVKSETREHLEEIILNGDAFFFQYGGKDYFIAWYEGAYQIQDPCIFEDGSRIGTAYIDYPENNQAKTPSEFMRLQFLDGKTILERFDELKFFD